MRVPRGKCRNGGRPFQGIDTIPVENQHTFIPAVEMEVAPFRALTHTAVIRRMDQDPGRRNGGRPFQGIDTGVFQAWQ